MTGSWKTSVILSRTNWADGRGGTPRVKLGSKSPDEPEVQGHVTAERVPDDDRWRDALRVEECFDVGAETRHGKIVRRCLEDGHGEGHGPTAGGQRLQDGLPVLARPEQPVKTQDREARSRLRPSKLRHCARLAHAHTTLLSVQSGWGLDHPLDLAGQAEQFRS
jgi:hypothetical protein